MVCEDEAISGKPTGIAGGGGTSSSESFSSQLRVELHQCLLADWLMDFHLRFAIEIDSRLKNNPSEQAAKRKTSISLIMGL